MFHRLTISLAFFKQNLFTQQISRLHQACRLRHWKTRYALAVCLVAFAVVSANFTGLIIGSLSFIFVACSVAISTIFLGVDAGLTSLLLAALASDFFLLSPIRALSMDSRIFLLALFYVSITLVTHLVIRKFLTTGFIGHVDSVVDGELQGWAFHANQPSEVTEVTVYVNNHRVAETAAVYFRPDVAQGFFCQGRCAFYLDISQYCDPQSQALVDVHLPDGSLLPGSGLQAEIPSHLPVSGPTVLFMHLAKTAGTAFRYAIAPNYKQSEIAYLYPDPPGFPHYCDLLYLPEEQRKRLRFVMGHFQFGIHSHLPQNSCTYVTVVRNPIDRVISHYLFLAQIQPAIIRDGNRPLFLPELFERRQVLDLDNQMVRCFSGVWDQDFPAGTITRDVYDLAVHHLRTQFAFVGHQKRAEAAYAAMQKRFNWWATPSLATINQAEHSLPENQYPAALKAIEHFNCWDLMLYQEILQLFPEEAASSAFAQKICSAKDNQKTGVQIWQH